MNKLVAAGALALAFSLPTQAALTYDVADLGNVSVVDFENFDGYYTTGPETVAPGVTFTGDQGSVLGAYIANLGTNGIWGAGNMFAATDVVGELRFTFDSLTNGVGAFVNHYADGIFPFSLVVSAYDDNNQIIETWTLSIDTDEYGYNEGMFVGITRDSADIRSLSFKGNYVVADNLAVAVPVPEPETWAMLLAGLGMMGMVARRRA